MDIMKLFCILSILTISAGCLSQKYHFGEPSLTAVTDPDGCVDHYMGDWQGTLADNKGNVSNLALEVAALGKGLYSVNLRNYFNIADPPFETMEFAAENGKLSQINTDKNTPAWEFEIVNNLLEAKADDARRISAGRVRRVSPSLGLKPPRQAIILFDGNSLDNWQLMRDFNGHLHLPGIHTGNSCNYLKTRLWSDIKQKVLLEAAHNHMMKLWLNGLLVYKEDTYIAPVRTVNSKRTEIELKKGWNDIFVKLVGYNVTSAAVRVVSISGDALATIAEEDIYSNTGARTRKFLDKANQHLTLWQYSGHYFIEDPDNKNLMDRAFAHEFTPETSPSKAEWRPLEVILKDGDLWTIKHRIVDKSLEIWQSGDIMTKQSFDDYYLHIEFQIPFDPDKSGQNRGNSGVYLGCKYELQILDSYGLLPTKQDCGAAYYIKPPDINMSLPPLEWQTYDIYFSSPEFDKERNKTENARATVYHNGVKIHDNIEFPNPTGGGMTFETSKAPIHLQNHGAPVRYRNIWIVEH
jgi:hypothetical protein